VQGLRAEDIVTPDRDGASDQTSLKGSDDRQRQTDRLVRPEPFSKPGVSNSWERTGRRYLGAFNAKATSIKFK
jgi:hypothetical protein